MKPLLLLFLLISTFEVYSQNSQEEPFRFECTEPLAVYGYDFNKKARTNVVKTASTGLKFIQIGAAANDNVLGEIAVIQITPGIKSTTDPFRGDAARVNSDDNGSYFCIPISVLNSKSVRKRYHTGGKTGKANFGTLVVPIKMRGEVEGIPFDFTTDFTLGTSFGYSWRISHYETNYLSLVGVFGVTSVNVNEASTRGLVTQDNTKFSAITPGIGAILEVSNFQIGAIVGSDIIGGTVGSQWVYNKKLWYSFGIGYQFLRKDSK